MMKLGCLIVLGATVWCFTWARHDVHNEVRVAKTVGHVWPRPQTIVSQTSVLQLDPITFYFQNGDGCEIIDSAFYRYQQLIFRPPLASDSNSVPAFNYLNLQPPTNATPNVNLGAGELGSLVVHLTGNCETWPSLYMDEQYQLKIDTSEIPQQGALIAASVWGVLRGLETFSQLIYKDHNTGLFLINSTFIVDFPRFPHRGILVDTSRHFVPLHLIRETLDAMAYNKFNVLHWHIVDDQSFPYQSRRFPNMSDLGAYEPIHHIYTFNDIQDIINYARLRGIRVVPEFDTPGHTLSWGAGITQLLTQCYNTTTGKPNGKFGPVNPILQSTYDFLAEFFAEAISLFPDKYIHLGGDEVPFDCWQSNPSIQNFMISMNFTDYRQLESFYMDNLLSSVDHLNVSSIVWQEVFDNGVGLSNDTVIEVWKSGGMPEMSAVTAAGYRALYASCWYLDIVNSATDWSKFYLCEPEDFSGSQKQMDLVIGGEACLWGEYVDASNLVARMWPRASATAERLWSNKTQTSVSEAAPRLEEMRCRLMTRGITAQPQNGPGFCDVDYLM